MKKLTWILFATLAVSQTTLTQEAQAADPLSSILNRLVTYNFTPCSDEANNMIAHAIPGFPNSDPVAIDRFTQRTSSNPAYAAYLNCSPVAAVTPGFWIERVDGSLIAGIGTMIGQACLQNLGNPAFRYYAEKFGPPGLIEAVLETGSLNGTEHPSRGLGMLKFTNSEILQNAIRVWMKMDSSSVSSTAVVSGNNCQQISLSGIQPVPTAE